MNSKGDKTRQGMNWAKYRAEHDRIFGKVNHKGTKSTKKHHLFPDVVDEHGRFRRGLGETIRGVK